MIDRGVLSYLDVDIIVEVGEDSYSSRGGGGQKGSAHDGEAVSPQGYGHRVGRGDFFACLAVVDIECHLNGCLGAVDKYIV